MGPFTRFLTEILKTFAIKTENIQQPLCISRLGLRLMFSQIFDILEKIDKELRKDPVTRNLVIGPIEIDGITEVKDYALEIRAVLKTSPGEYHKVRWAFNRLLKQYLEAGNVPPATPSSY